MKPKLFVIDTFSLLFQVYHAIPPMTSPSGQQTNAVYGFTRDLLNILRDQQPTHVVCALDAPGPGERQRLYEAYKANRAEIPEDLAPQIPLVQQLVDAFGFPAVQYEGWEADDVAATIARQAVEKGFDVYIVTNDKDARQLIRPGVRLYNVRKGSVLDEQAVQQEWGIRPDQVVDFQALVGDASDNVPGVPGVGVKTAAALLQQFGTLENILANADQVSAKRVRENLKKYAEQARLCRQLVRLRDDLPLEFDPETSRIGRIDLEKLNRLFRDLGFRRFGREVSHLVESRPELAAEQKVDYHQGVLFARPAPTRTWTVVDTPEKFEQFMRLLRQQKKFCLDLETTSLNEMRADIVGWAFSWKDHEAYYIPVRAPAGQRTLDPDQVLAALRDILEDPEIEVVNQNIKYDMLVLRRAGVRLRGIGLDPMIGSYLLNAGARSHGLDTLAEVYLGHRMIPIKSLIGSGRSQRSMAEVDVASVAEYATEDADITWQLARVIEQELRKEGLWNLYWDVERPLITVLADMEFRGVRVDVDELRWQSEQIGRKLQELVEEIYELAGCRFNIDSPKQLREVLFDRLQLPVLKKTKTGPSTDQSVLEKLALLHPLPERIIRHRQLAKLKSTYLDALPQMVNPETGRIHTSYQQVATATGRLSSANPNLQNIPIRTEEGRRIRRAFIPSEPGWVLLCADYSQIELRMLAHLSGDPVLCEAFAEGADIHAAVAAQIAGVPQDQVDSDLRRVAKAVNFGIIYGQSPYGLSQAIGISQEEAAEFIEQYFAKYARVAEFLDELLEECRRTGYARTILGRRRAIRGIRAERSLQRNMPERTAINTVIQGSAADLIKVAMILLHTKLEREKSPARMLLQIHDELVFEVPEAALEETAAIVREVMESAMPLRVPLKTDLKAGPNWLDLEPVEVTTRSSAPDKDKQTS